MKWIILIHPDVHKGRGDDELIALARREGRGMLPDDEFTIVEHYLAPTPEENSFLVMHTWEFIPWNPLPRATYPPKTWDYGGYIPSKDVHPLAKYL